MRAESPFRTIPACAFLPLVAALSLCLGQGCPGTPDPGGTDDSHYVYGDGSAGDLTVSSDSLLSAVAPTGNLQFHDVTINAGATLTVPSGTTFRCTGTFTNNGTLLVSTGTIAPANGGAGIIANPGIALAGAESDNLTGSRGGQGLSSEQALVVLDAPMAAGGAGATTAIVLYIPDAATFVGGNGGGGLLVLAEGPITNAGTIQANGGNASATGGGGGGAGGVIILASPASINNSGSIVARGGNGGNATADSCLYGAGGGGGGGLVRLLSPSVAPGTIDVTGGTGGAGAAGGVAEFGGGGGGGCGGNGGSAGRLTSHSPYASEAGQAGGAGQVISTLTDPTSLY